jgi:hypothetical protein
VAGHPGPGCDLRDELMWSAPAKRRRRLGLLSASDLVNAAQPDTLSDPKRRRRFALPAHSKKSMTTVGDLVETVAC